MFRKINKWCTKQYIMLPIIGVFTFVSCQKITVVPVSTSQANQTESANQTLARVQAKYTGEEIFEAIFFSRGELVKMLPSFDFSLTYEGMPSNKLANVDLVIKGIEDKLIAKNQEYFKDFREDLKNAEVADFEAIIERTSLDVAMVLLQDQNVKDNFINLYNLSAAQVATILINNDTVALKQILYSNGEGIGLGGQNKVCLAVAAVVVLVVWEAAAAVNVAIVATAVVAVWAKVCFWGSNAKTNKSDPIAFELAMSELYGVIN